MQSGNMFKIILIIKPHMAIVNEVETVIFINYPQIITHIELL